MTRESTKKVIDAAELFAPEPPRPLVREMPDPDPFPVKALGSLLCAAAAGIQDKTQAPAAICAQSVLAAATLAVQAHRDVVLPTGQARPVSNDFVTIAATGERKSAVDGEALWPIRKREEALREKCEEDRPGYQNEFDAWKKARDRILKDGKRDRAQTKAALDSLGAEPIGPLVPLLTCPEPTFQGLERLFASGHPSLGIFAGEGGSFIGGHGMAEENRLRTATGLSSLWDGDPLKRVRAGDGVVILPGRRLSVHLMMQPGVAAGLLADEAMADQGLLSRLLVTAPETTSGTRLWREPSPESDSAVRRYGARLLTILERPYPLSASGKPNELAPALLPMSAAARRVWIAFADHIEKQVGPGGELEPVRGLANKAPEHAARLAAVLALVDDLNMPELPVEAMEAGIALVEHYLAEAMRLFSVPAVPENLKLAQKLLVWLQSFGADLVSLRDIYRDGPNAIRDKATAARSVAVLEDHGWLRRQGPATGRRGDLWRIVRA